MLLIELHCRLSYVYMNAVVERGVLMDPVCGRFNTPDLHKPINQYINIRLKDIMSEKNGGKILKSGKKNIKKSKK